MKFSFRLQLSEIKRDGPKVRVMFIETKLPAFPFVKLQNRNTHSDDKKGFQSQNKSTGHCSHLHQNFSLVCRRY
jgi:hypothetical protein